MNFESLEKEVEKGLTGSNEGLPMGFNRLNKYIGLRKSLYFLIGGLTGSGKTSFVDDCFVLNPYDWYISPENKSNVKLQIIYRSMERSKEYKLAKWIIRKIFLDYGIVIPMGTLLGWKGFPKLTKDQHDLFLLQREYIEKMSGVIKIISGAENPVGIAKELKAHALENGVIEQIDEYNKLYIPNNENEITIVVLDHIGLLRLTKDLPTKKAAIDKMSMELQHSRDFYGYTPVVVSQFNRDISNPMRLKNGDVEPQLEDFADSSQTQNDCDVTLALFDPFRYKVDDPSGYDLNKLRDEQGAKYFRSLRLIKNSFGNDDLRIGLGFFGEIGMFKELKRKNDMTDGDYESVRNKTWFFKE